MPRSSSRRTAPRTRSASYRSAPSFKSSVPAVHGGTRSPVPAAAPAPAPVAPAQQGPGLFGQMASTAAGVAVGSTVGHMAGAAIVGALGGPRQPAAEPVADSAEYHEARGGAVGGPCATELQQFVECSSRYNDSSLCANLQEALKQCYTANGTLVLRGGADARAG